MNNEVTVSKGNALALPAEMMSVFEYDAVEATDLKIPKLLLMQAMSKYVNEDGTAKAGDLVNSLSGAALGCVREKGYQPVQFVPFKMTKTWVIQEMDEKAKKFVYKETVPVTPENTDWEWLDGKIKRTKCLNVYALLTSQLGDATAVPYVITFRNTSFKSGTLIANHFAVCRQAQQAKVMRVPPDTIFELGGKVQSNDEGTWYTFTVREVGASSAEAVKQAAMWAKNLSTMKHIVDDSDVSEEAVSTSRDV